MPVSLVHRECSIAGATCYARYRPEQTLLYQVVERYCPLFLSTAAAVFRRVSASTTAQLQRLLERISQRIGHYLERSGWLQRDEDSG